MCTRVLGTSLSSARCYLCVGLSVTFPSLVSGECITATTRTGFALTHASRLDGPAMAIHSARNGITLASGLRGDLLAFLSAWRSDASWRVQETAANADIASLQSALILVLALAALTALFFFASRAKAFERAALRALRIGGPVPRHVAFIMDGNRRWARKGGMEPHEGHPRGGEKLIESLQWCLDAGVDIVTVYAFSIENFKRPQREIDEIMDLAEDKFKAMLQRSDVIQENQVCVRVLGNLDLVPVSLRTMMSRAMADTCKYTAGPTLNICFSYTSRFDIANSISSLIDLCDQGQLEPADISDHTITACLSTGYARGADAQSPFPELLIRTSGETRLSDFLLWESSHSVLSFCDVLWPDLKAWDFVKILLDYQTQARGRAASIARCNRARVRSSYTDTSSDVQEGWNPARFPGRVRSAIDSVRKSHFEQIKLHARHVAA